MEIYITFLPTIIFSLLYAIPLLLLARSKGYTSIIWVIISVLPFVNFLSMILIIALPDKIAREYLAELKELEKIS